MAIGARGRRGLFVTSFLSGALALTSVTAPAQAQSVESFYKDRQMKFILSASLSGGYGLYAHTITPFLEKHLPGRPNIVVMDMPGAGGLVAANWLANVAPKDGSVISMIHRSAVSTAPLFGAQNVRFDPTKFGWVGNMNNDLSVCVIWHGAAAKNFADLKTKPSIFGGVGAGSDIDMYTNMLVNLFDTKMRLVSGYKSSDGIHLAMERGEVEGRCGWGIASLLSTKGDWVKDKKINILVQIGLEKHPAIPDVPLLSDQTNDPEMKLVLETISSPLAMGRPILTAPNVPPERLAALRKAFDDAMADPGFKADAEKKNLEYSYASGEKIAAIIDRLYSMPKPVVEKAARALESTRQ
jgi:tripartite-type tricarboxylate transporter receptor subunit TctC